MQVADKDIALVGAVIDLGGKGGDLRVEAFDDDGVWPDLIDCAITGPAGQFRMSLAPGYLAQLLPDRAVRLSFRVFRDQTLLADTRGRLVWTLADPRRPVQIVLDPKAPASRARTAPFVVLGTAFDAARRPLAGGMVTVAHRSLATESSRTVRHAVVGLHDEPIATAQVGADGEFRLEYRTRGAAKLDLVLATSDRSGIVLVEDLYCRAAASLLTQLMPPAARELPEWPGPSQFERRLAALRPVLGERSPADLDERESEYVACASRLDPDELASLRAVARFARETGVATGVVAALDHAGLPLHLGALLAYRGPQLADAVERAIADNAVPAGARDNLAAGALAALRERVVEYALRPAPQGAPVSFGDVLGAGGLPVGMQADLLRHYVEWRGTPKQFWAALATDRDFGPAALAQLRLALQLAIFTGADPALMAALREGRNGMGSASELAQLDEERWEHLLRQGGTVQPAQARARAVAITAGLEFAYSGAALNRRLAQSPQRDRIRDGAVRILANLGNPDLGTARLRRLVAERGGAAFDGVDATERQLAVEQLLAAQRVFRVASPQQVLPLLDAGYQSARAIALTPPIIFVNRLADTLGGQAAARAVHSSAVVYSAGVAAGYQTFTEAFAGHLPYVIAGEYSQASPGDKQDKLGQALPPAVKDNVADWRTLFGQLELCDCEHCESSYSPAAYLVDLLHFLDAAPPGATKPIEVLRERRPDLMQTLLTCPNTNTPLPYVDLVKEVLESYIDIKFADPPNTGATLAVYDVGTATAAELRAVPQHVIDPTYERLRTAI